MKKLILVQVAVLAIVVAARAEEGGTAPYAPGSFASFIDALPSEPGFVVFDYFTYYSGDASASRTFPIAGQITANVAVLCRFGFSNLSW